MRAHSHLLCYPLRLVRPGSICIRRRFWRPGKHGTHTFGSSNPYQPGDGVEIPVEAGQGPNVTLATSESNQPVIEVQFSSRRPNQLHHRTIETWDVGQ